MLDLEAIEAHEQEMRAADPQYDPAGDEVVRASGLGGSDMASVLGVDPYRSRLETWARKCGTWPSAELGEPDISKLEPIRLGRALEDDICRLFAEDHGLKLQRYIKTPRHRDHPWAMAHPDRRVVGGWRDWRRVVVEAKWTSVVDAWGEPETDQVPERFLPQIHQEMWVTNADACLVPVWLFRFRIERAWFVVERDPEWDQILADAGDAFWSCVEGRVEPPHVAYDEPSTQTAIRRLYGRDVDPERFLKWGAHEMHLAEAIATMSKAASAYTGAVDAMRAELQHRMGDAAFARLPDGSWYRRVLQKRKGYEVEPTEVLDFRRVKSLPKGVKSPFAEDREQEA